MRIVKVAAMENGAHCNQSPEFDLPLPDGWAVIPDGMELPNFPFGEIEAEEIGGVMTVTRWTAGVIPSPESEPEPEPTDTEVLNTLLGVSE